MTKHHKMDKGPNPQAKGYKQQPNSVEDAIIMQRSLPSGKGEGMNRIPTILYNNWTDMKI